MSIDWNKYNSDEQTERTDTDSYGGGLAEVISGSWIYRLIVGAVRYYTWKMAFYGLLIVTIPMFAYWAGTTDGLRAEKTADEMSKDAAGYDWIGAIGIFNKNVIRKSTKLNEHPYYHLDKVKEQEKEFFETFGYEIEVGKLFKYYIYDEQEYLVMKRPAKGHDKDKLTLELSTFTGMDAEDYCDIFKAVIWDDELKQAFKGKMALRGKKGELTQDNDDKARHFRCVILPDTIEDALDD
jgi:hypothetical protein